jgi:hypothetical protein
MLTEEKDLKNGLFLEISDSWVICSSVVLYRQVMNDINVGEWTKITPFVHDLEGLRKWMEKEGGWDFTQVKRGGSWNSNVYTYSNHLQFYIPNLKNLPQHVKESLTFVDLNGVNWQVRCVNAVGLDNLTNGKTYICSERKNGLLTLTDDYDNLAEFFEDRFEKI